MLKQNLSQKLLQKLSPQQIQFAKLLQLNALNFEQKIEEEIIENPALELGKDNEDSITEFDNSEFDSPIETNETTEISDFDDDVEPIDTLIQKEELNDDFFEDFDDWESNYGQQDDYVVEDEKSSMPIVEITTFRQNLLEQAATVCHDHYEYTLATQLIGSLDDDGYLRRELKSICNDLMFGNNINSSEQELESVLKKIQEFEPFGIGARTLQECLLIQLYQKEKKGKNPILELSKEIITNYMDEFSKKHYEKIQEKLDIHQEYLKEAISFISKLNPKPAYIAGEEKSESIIPDFVVTENYGELEITLNSINSPELRLSPSFTEILKDYENKQTKDKSLKEAVTFLKQKVDNARWFIDAIKQRQITLLSTMNSIVQIQKAFFLSGEESKLKPMKLKDIAEMVKLDISTISRVATSKYVQTDYGIFLLKFFFSEGIMNEDGEEVSTREIKKIIIDTIEAENKKHPITDDELTNMINKKGFTIARRTVAKYREQLNIPVARLRKDF